MKLYVNGEEKEDLTCLEQTLSGLVGFASTAYVPAGEVISQVKVDGEAVLWTRDESALETCSSIEITTCSTKDLLVSGLLEVYRICPSFQERLRQTADTLGTSQHENALKDMVECADTLQWFYSVLSGVERLLGVSLQDAHLGDDGRFASHLSALKNIVQSVSTVLQNENFVLLSDILRYELVPCMEELQSFFPVLLKEIDRKLLTLS